MRAFLHWEHKVAFVFDLNNSVLRQGQAMLTFKDSWVANGGATVVQSGDGAGVGPASVGDLNGDVLTDDTHGGSFNAPNAIANTGAWFVVRLPNGREFMFYRATSTSTGLPTWRVSYSASEGFNREDYGSVGVSVPPSALDETLLSGSYNMSLANGLEFWNDATDVGIGLDPGINRGRAVLHMMFGDADEDYAMYALATPAGNWGWAGGMYIDTLVDPNPNVADAVVIGVEDDQRSLTGWQSSASNRRQLGAHGFGYPKSWYDEVGGIWKTEPVPKNPIALSCFTLMNGVATNPNYRYGTVLPANGVLPSVNGYHGGIDDFGPVLWMVGDETSSYNRGRAGYLGKSRIFRRCSTTDEVRDITDDLQYRIVGGNYMIPWDGSTAPRMA